MQLVRKQHQNENNSGGIMSPFLFREIPLQSELLTLGSLAVEDLLHLGLGTHFGENIHQILKSVIDKI